MFRPLVIAAATAAIALPLVTATGSTAEAQSARFAAQTKQIERFKAPTQRQVEPGPGRPKPMDGLGSQHIDLVGEFLNPQIKEGQPGSHFCSSEPGQGRSRHVQIVVRNQGNTLATPVRVSFLFSSGHFMTENIQVIQPGAAKGAAVAIPDSAWKNGKAQFQISLDPTNTIGETNEGNNTFHSFCTDPS